MNYQNTLMYKEINETPGILSRITMDNNKTVMDALIKEVGEKKLNNIVAAARGTSGHALIYFKYLTEIFTGFTVGFSAPSVVTAYGGKVNYSQSFVIGVSQSGKAADVMEILKRANSEGAVTLAVTNDVNSPMAKTAKYHLFCGCGEEKSVAATKTFSAQMYILAWLAGELSKNAEILNVLKSVPGKLENALPVLEKHSESIKELLKDDSDGFVLSRGISSALSMETALKLQETCYYKMKGYAYSDFQHGPMAMVGKGTPIIFFAPKIGFAGTDAENARISEIKQVLEKMESFGGKVIVITDNNYYDGYGSLFKLPESGNEVAGVFLMAMLAQLTACKLSCAVGNNPDSPRALNKVTITK